MLRFSLVVATLGRTNELSTLLTSIRDQQREDVEVILIDQNDDDRVEQLLSRIALRMNVSIVKFPEKNVSAARNCGLDLARGEIVAFPDDDCHYAANLLDNVDHWFQVNSDYGVLAVGAVDDEGLPSGNRWLQSSCDITSWNSLRTTFCSSLFISTIERSREVRFDPALNRGEETDFILRLLSTGIRGRYDRSMTIVHPRRDMTSGTVSIERAISYGAGMGRLVRRHSLIVLWAGLLMYDLARVLIVTTRGKTDDAAFCFAHAKGLWKGFVLPEGSYE